jgi:hypothetical protein
MNNSYYSDIDKFLDELKKDKAPSQFDFLMGEAMAI